MIDKLEAARRQIECAIRLVVDVEDRLAVHTIVMASFGILSGLAKGRSYYELGVWPHLTKMGNARLKDAANFLKHADRDPGGKLEAFDDEENDWRIGFCIILYRDLAGQFTPTMAAFHAWMVVRHPQEFQLAEDDDKELEAAFREADAILEKSDRRTNLVLLDALVHAFKSGVIPPEAGYRRRLVGRSSKEAVKRIGFTPSATRPDRCPN